MILADSSIWIDHWRQKNPEFDELLDGDVVGMHVFVIGELALGAITPRAPILADLRTLPPVTLADHAEVLALIEHRRLFSRGIGWVDSHLLASALLDEAELWTHDTALARVAAELGVGFRPHRR